jgi:hypothetical protein
LEYAKLNFPILNNYSAGKHLSYIQATILEIFIFIVVSMPLICLDRMGHDTRRKPQLE